MSGGSLDYTYNRVEWAASEIPLDTPLRRAFVAHLRTVADTLRAIEWHLSGDTGQESEEEAIRRCLTRATTRAGASGRSGASAVARKAGPRMSTPLTAADLAEIRARDEFANLQARPSQAVALAAIADRSRLLAEVERLRSADVPERDRAFWAPDAMGRIRRAAHQQDGSALAHAVPFLVRRMERAVAFGDQALRDMNAALAEVERLRPREQHEGSTHWDGCWRARDHHECAVVEVERLREESRALTDEWARMAEIEELRVEVARLTDERDRARHLIQGMGINRAHDEGLTADQWWLCLDKVERAALADAADREVEGA